MQSRTSSLNAQTRKAKTAERTYAGSPDALVNRTLLKKNLSRFWPLWGLVSFLGALFPLALLVSLIRDPSIQLSPQEVTQSYYSVISLLIPGISLVYAMLCASAVWRYLDTSRSVGMMHTLPITRRSLLATNFLSGWIMMEIPYAVTGLLCVLVTGAYGGFELTGVLTTVAAAAGISFFYFCSATVVAFVTGSAVAQAVLYFIFHFLAVALEWLGVQFAQGFAVGLSGSAAFSVTRYLSPTVGLMVTLHADGTYQEISVSGEQWTSYELTGVQLEGFWLVGVYVLVGIVLLAMAWLLYSHRRSESAGDVVAVSWMKPAFRYGVALCAALSAGQALYLLFWDSFQDTYSAYYAAVPMAVCTAIAGLLGYYIASMLLAKTVRVFRSTWKGALAVCIVCVSLCVGLRVDLFGIEKRVPAASEITSVTLEVAGDTYTLKTGEDDALIAQTLKLHKTIADSAESLRSSTLNETEWDEQGSASLFLNYQLGGIQLKRRYELPITKQLLAQEESYAWQLDQLMNNAQMQEKLLNPDTDNWILSGGQIYSCRGGENLDLNSDQARELQEALLKDCKAGHWKHYSWLYNDDDSAETYALDVTLEFSSKKDLDQGNDREKAVQLTSRYITVRTDMTETIRCLKELGVAQKDLISYSEYNKLTEESWTDDLAENDESADEAFDGVYTTMEG